VAGVAGVAWANTEAAMKADSSAAKSLFMAEVPCE
jgi:hypothetical protein